MPPLGWRGDDPWPLVEDAKRGLEALALGKSVELGFGGRSSDRHGHLLAQVFVVAVGERVWLQQDMVARGLARVYSFADNRACTPELLAREQEARSKRRGLWNSSAYRIVQALDLEPGTLDPHLSIGRGQGRRGRRWRIRIYLNFAQDWRRDFTISVERKEVGAFAAAGIDLKARAGKRLRVRGTLAWRNGPMIEASHPDRSSFCRRAPPRNVATKRPAIAL